MQYYDNFSTYGKIMYDICLKGARFLYKHKVLYYILNYTWGILYSLIGLLVSLILLICKHNPERFDRIWMFIIEEYWGGASIGTMFITGKEQSQRTIEHEYGHTYQNAILGPFTILLVSIPSFIRYFVINYKIDEYKKKGKRYEYTYDNIWFEASATDIGKELLKEEK